MTGLDCVIPAAGASSRMGQWKLLLPWGSSTIVETVVNHALQACSRVILVTGFRGDELAALFAGVPRVVCVDHPGWEAGMASSLQQGVAEVSTPQFFVALADMPLVSPDLFLRVAHAFADVPVSVQVCRPTFGGKPGHPVLFDQSVVPSILAWKGGETLRDLVKTLEVVTVPVDDPGTIQDFDVPADYAARSFLGVSLGRDDAGGKTTGAMRFTDDYTRPGMLHAAVLASPHAHADILAIRTDKAKAAPGVRGVFTGADWSNLIGLYMGDKPPLARGRVRYHGEPVAVVVADDEASAWAALRLVEVDYRPLPALLSPADSLAPGATVLHPQLASYTHIPAIFPEPGTNVAHRTKVRKGDAEKAMAEADVVVEGAFGFPPGDHLALEPRAVHAEISGEGRLVVRTSTQSPFGVRTLLARSLGMAESRIEVVVGAVGGGFGGKAGIQLEPLACLLTQKLDGRPVRLVNTREADLLSSPGRPGLEARIRLGAQLDGTLVAADIEFWFDSGAYADYAVNVARAAGYACTGPYRIPHVKADSLCVYTNHPFATAFRGFGHIELSFAMERAIDLLADKLGVDPADLRRLNAVRPGDTTPSQTVLDPNTGNLPACLDRVKQRLGWRNSRWMEGGLVHAQGISAFWKAPAIPTFTDAGALLTFAEDGSVTLATGVVELGQGAHTGLRQMVAEALKLDPVKVRVVPHVDTDTSPHDWATAASRSLFMAGRAALDAVADAVAQIKKTASGPLRCPEEDLEVAGGRVYLRDDPHHGLDLAQVVLGYVYPNGNAIGGPIIGRGKYIARLLSNLNPETGEGRPGLEWTLGACGIEIELDPSDGRFRVVKAACTMDVGRLINPDLARGQVVGALAMGIGFSTRENFVFDAAGRVLNASLRDLKLLRYGEEPEYLVDFLETPQGDGPFGARGLGEQGIIGVPGALAQAVSKALGVPVTRLPLAPESVWKLGGGKA